MASGNVVVIVHEVMPPATLFAVFGSVPLPPSNLTPEGNDFRSAVEPFPPLLIPPALRPFLTFDRRYGCPLHALHEVLALAV